ncbi:serine/arginine repetitive matrix protein 1-like [Hordeum vulgare subsp. vulgare]|uniref:serine/arginine repetitive matrix protein 1-like n=1 Tax=Hordeum vulgare subsp. vulgare TaxID=112509 RepID=UPI001D1A3F89|nr:serine/arginine repetitive matrix protein 1-like [Hordeum vulgare subsp. vulgare]
MTMHPRPQLSPNYPIAPPTIPPESPSRQHHEQPACRRRLLLPARPRRAGHGRRRPVRRARPRAPALPHLRRALHGGRAQRRGLRQDPPRPDPPWMRSSPRSASSDPPRRPRSRRGRRRRLREGEPLLSRSRSPPHTPPRRSRPSPPPPPHRHRALSLPAGPPPPRRPSASGQPLPPPALPNPADRPEPVELGHDVAVQPVQKCEGILTVQKTQFVSFVKVSASSATHGNKSFGLISATDALLASIKKVSQTDRSLGVAGFVVAVEDSYPGTKFDPVPVNILGILITDVSKTKDLIDYYNSSTTRDWAGRTTTFQATVGIADGLAPTLFNSAPQVALFSSRGPDVKDFSFQDADVR